MEMYDETVPSAVQEQYRLPFANLGFAVGLFLLLYFDLVRFSCRAVSAWCVQIFVVLGRNMEAFGSHPH